MLKNFKIICGDGSFYKILILFLGLIFAAILELVGIGSIPIFVMLITDINLLKSKIPDFLEIDFIFELSTIDIIIYAAVVLTFIFLIKNLYLALITFYQGLVYKRLRINLSSKLFSIYTNINYSFHLQNNPAILLRNIEGEASRAITVIQSIISLFKEFLILLVVFFLLMITDPIISLFAFFILSIFVGIFYLLTNNRMLKNGKIIQFIRGEQVKHINQSLGAIKEVKILNKENFLFRIFSKNLNIFENAYLENYFLSSLPRLFLELIVISTLVVVVISFVYFDRNIANIIPLLSLLVIAAVRLMPSFNTISTSLAKIRDLTPSYNLVADEISKLENKQINLSSKVANNVKFENNILINNLSFKYEKTEKYALENLILDIKVGTKIGIIGNSGAGKSTFVDLILGLLSPTKGKIEVDNQNIQNNMRDWQNLIGYVPQDIYLLDETIQNNIALGVNKDLFNENKFEIAVKIAQLEDFIKNLKLGRQTIVGNRGVRLSGGQRQRIGIARALYNNNKILVFDEATNSLDLENEKKIIENIFLLDKNKTLLLVTHRHETVKQCDEILLFNGGKLIDQGDYNYLNRKYHLNIYIKKKD